MCYKFIMYYLNDIIFNRVCKKYKSFFRFFKHNRYKYFQFFKRLIIFFVFYTFANRRFIKKYKLIRFLIECFYFLYIALNLIFLKCLINDLN